MMKLKHRRFNMICAFAITALAIGSVTAFASAPEYIGDAEAMAIALENAGVSKEQATFVNVRQERDDGRVVYDVEFYSGNTEYDYEIDAVSGEIREFDRDIERYSIPVDESLYIGLDGAKAIALEHAGVTGEQASFTRERIDRDDRRAVYELTFSIGEARYGYEIDALSGEIRDYSYRAAKPAREADASNPANYIGEEEAAASALNDADLAESDVRRLRAKLEREDGRMVYEVEFRSGQIEYEYEIDPVNGSVIKADIEYDD